MQYSMYLLIFLYLVDNLLPQIVGGWLATMLVAHSLNSLRMSMSVDDMAELLLMIVNVA